VTDQEHGGGERGKVDLPRASAPVLLAFAIQV
jgi:hypothetical protein